MSDEHGSVFDDAAHTDGMWAAYSRASSRYGRRHHDHDDRWQKHTGPVQDVD
jgi:hypothetical protein